MASDSQHWSWLSLFLPGAALLYVLAPVLTPFVVSALLAYLGDPLVDRLERLRFRRYVLGRSAGVVVVFIGMLVVGVLGLLILLPTLQRQVLILLNGVPQLLEWFQSSLAPRLAALAGVPVPEFDIVAIRRALLSHWQEVGSLAGSLVQHLGRSGQFLLGWLSYLLLIPVVTSDLLRAWARLVAAIHDLLPRRVAPTVSRLAAEIDAVLAEFLRGQVTVMAALAGVYVAGLWLVGLDLAFVIGMLAGVVSFVPYLGVIVGVVVAGLAAFLQFGDLAHLVAVAGVFAGGQVLEGMVLSPWLVGDRIGLHPVAVIFAVMAGGQLFGFFGVLLALPVAAVVVVLLRHSHDEYLKSTFYA